ncbi:MAG TPA: OmpA family protein [Polyangiaceae bacterium]|nr:OmpA family protein [Polyangiaceae bacterium]
MRAARLLPALGASLLLTIGVGCSKPPPPRPVPPPEAQPEIPPWFPEKPWNERAEDTRVFFEGKVVFDTDSSTIKPGAEQVLEQLLDWLQKNPDVSRIRIEGHTDNRASEEYNQGLSERRAIAVANWLVDHGLDHNRILAVAFGESRPLTRNDTPAGRQENRRAAFRPAEVDGRRFRGEDPTAGGLVLTVLSREEREALKKKAEVPKIELPPVKPEKNIIKPIATRNFQGEQAKGLLEEKPATIDAATGEVQESPSE